MGNPYPLERGVVYPVTKGPFAGELGPAAVRTLSLWFEVASPSGATIRLPLDISSIAKKNAIVAGLFTVEMRGRIVGDHSQELGVEYNPHTRTGELRLL